MVGSGRTKLRRQLESLQRAAAAGDQGAANRAKALATYLASEDTASDKRADDRVKVLVGAWIGTQLSAGRSVALEGPTALLEALDGFLVRPGEREAIFGEDGHGSAAFHRVVGITAVAQVGAAVLEEEP